MANYVKATNFTAKDALPSGNSGKIVKGAELDKVEFEGSNKIVFHQHADGTIYLTSQSNNYLVRYPINY